MTLLDKFKQYLLIAMVGFLFACEDPIDIGDTLNQDSKIEVLYKEFILPASNVFIDSIRTDISSRIMVGKYSDPTFGETVATGYSQFTTTNLSFEVRKNQANEFIIDSAFVELDISYYHSSDSLQGHDFTLHSLADTLISNVYYLSNFQTPHNNDGIGSINSFVYNASLDSIRIPLTDLFAKQYLEYIEETVDVRYAYENQITNNDTIQVVKDTLYNINSLLVNDFFKGIAIEPGANNNGIFGFDLSSANSKIGIYYKIERETETDTVSASIELPSLSSGAEFYTLQTDRSSSPLTIVNKTDTLITDVTTSSTDLYLQSGSGIHPKINLQPYIDFLNTLEFVVINKTEFEFTLTDTNTDFKYLQKPADLRLLFYSGGRNINASGLLSNDIRTAINVGAQTNGAYLGGAPSYLNCLFDAEKNTYTGDATIFSQFIEAGDIDANDLILIPSDVSSLNSAIFDGTAVKMKIYYTVPK